jgi:hypothetical protein
MPRKKLVADPIVAGIVRRAAQVGTPKKEVCIIAQISPEVLDRLYRADYDEGRTQTRMAVRGKLLQWVNSADPQVSLRAIQMFTRNNGMVMDVDGSDNDAAQADAEMTMATLEQRLKNLSLLELRVLSGMAHKMGDKLPGDGGGPPLIDGRIIDVEEEE